MNPIVVEWSGVTEWTSGPARWPGEPAMGQSYTKCLVKVSIHVDDTPVATTTLALSFGGKRLVSDALDALTLGLRSLCGFRCRQLQDWARAAKDLRYNMPSRHTEKLIALGESVDRLIGMGLITEAMLASAEDDAP